MSLLARVKEKLEAELEGSLVEIVDDSAAHAGHGASGAHLSVRVTFAGFEGKPLLEQHRMIYDILDEEMGKEIHALAIKTKVS